MEFTPSLMNCYVIGMTRNTQIFYKASGSPESEMDRGQEHAGKVEVGESYNLLQANVAMDECPYLTCETDTTAFYHKCILTLQWSDQSQCNCGVSYELNESLGVQPKATQTVKWTNTGLPKWGDPYGDGVSIVGVGYGKSFNPSTKVRQIIRTYSTKAAVTKNSEFNSGVEWISKMKKCDDGRYTGLYKLICSKELLSAAYSEIKSNPGNMTPGIEKLKFDQFSLSTIDRLIEELKTEKLKFTSVKRVFIPKKNGNMRPLGIPKVQDKIIQKAMAMILTFIFEPQFSDSSHGFRPNRSTHSALRDISTWKGTVWAIEGDIKGFFDNINHAKLIEILSRQIRDQQFIDLVWNLLRAGYLEGGQFKPSQLGVPQGGIVSPILSNIYLNVFDKFMEKYIDTYSSKDKLISKVNSVIVKYSNTLNRLNEEYLVSKDREILKRIREVRAERNKIPSRIRTGIRIRYVRYADDWVVGIIGARSVAVSIKETIKSFLEEELMLELSEDKTLITHLPTNKAKFMGVYFYTYTVRRSTSPMIVRRVIQGKFCYSRINNVRIHFAMPTREIINSMIDKGFILEKQVDGKKNLVPFAITKWIFLDHRGIILRYNSVIDGLYNYYFFVNNTADFWNIQYFLQHSCAKTLARKLNLHSRAKVFQKFGYNLTARAEPGTKQKDIGLKLRDSFAVISNGLSKAKSSIHL